MNATKLIAACALFAWAGTAQATDYSLVVHGFSHHTEQRKSGKPWNSTNYGISIRAQTSADVSFQVGAYKDSVFKPTVYALIDYTPLHYGNFSAGGFIGAKYSTALKPILGGLVRYERAGWAVTGRVGPAPQSGGWVYMVELGRSF